MRLEQMMNYAVQHSSKLQTENYFLTQEELNDLTLIWNRIQSIPSSPDCSRITLPNKEKYQVDLWMNKLFDLLSNTHGTKKDFHVFVALNFTWSHEIGDSTAVGVMRILLSVTQGQQQKRPTEKYIERCVATQNSMVLDEILPEKNMSLVSQHIRAYDVRNSSSIENNILSLFAKPNPTEKEIQDVISMLHPKKGNDRIYMAIRVFVHRDGKENPWIVRVSILNTESWVNDSFSFPQDDLRFQNTLHELLKAKDHDPLHKLRLFASKRQLPFFEKTYHVPEKFLLEFSGTSRRTKWENLGILIYNQKQEWDKLPPFSGIFQIRLAVCREQNILHFVLNIPYLRMTIETPLAFLKEAVAREFFPETKYKKIIKKHAENPSLPSLPPEDSFLHPYIQASRYSILEENVRDPDTHRSIPQQLVGEIEKSRQKYKKILQQHVRRFPKQDFSRMSLHPSYTQEINKILREKQKQHAVQRYVYQEPLKQIPQSHAFRQELQRKRQQIRQKVSPYETPKDLVDMILDELELNDPITFLPIRNPVRAPHSNKMMFQKQSLQQWLSRNDTNPFTRQKMPKHFKPHVDPSLHDFITKLYNKMDAILEDEGTDDFAKKVHLWRLYQDIQKHNIPTKIQTSKLNAKQQKAWLQRSHRPSQTVIL